MVVIVTTMGKGAIEDYFERSFELENMLRQKDETNLAEEICRLSHMVDICYVRQKEQRGLGHAVLTARSVVGDEPFNIPRKGSFFLSALSLVLLLVYSLKNIEIVKR